MEKPDNIFLKDFLIAQTAKESGTDEQLCDLIINWGYRKVKELVNIHGSIELSGFGKLILSANKINNNSRRMNRMISFTKIELENIEEEKRERVERKLNSQMEKLEYYNKRNEQTV